MQPGDVVGGRFEIERHADAGGMATVYRAHDRLTGAPVALKILHGEAGVDRRRFDREATVLAGIRHPAVVRYVDHGPVAPGEDARYLAMEWLEGETLAERLGREGLSVAEAVLLGRRVASGLAALHRVGVVHRDVKPRNLLLCAGRVERVAVIDLGVAHVEARRGEITLGGAMIGTPGTMAPEQARGERDIDARVDVFALGCVLFKCLTGRSPFPGDDAVTVLAKTVLEPAPRASALRADIPPALDALVARMMAKDRDERPYDGEAVAEALAALGDLAGPPPSSMRPSLSPALTARERRVLCVVLARPDARASLPPAGPTLETLAGGELDPRLEIARQSAEALGGQAEILSSGAVLVAVAGPGVATEQAARAARCALALRECLPGAAVVLATGRGEAEGGGALDHRARAPVGEVIDRAAELLRAASLRARRGPQDLLVCIDEVTAGLLDARFQIGSDEGGLVLRGERDAHDGRDWPTKGRTLLGRATPCVGREREIAVLEGLFEECAAEPRARVALILGPAGIGKTRVLHELVARVSPRAAIWTGSGDSMAPGSPFGLIAPALRRAAGVLEGEPLDLRQKKLRARVGRHLGPGRAPWRTSRDADLPRLAEFLGEIAGVPFPEEESVQLRAARRDAMLMGDQMRRAWVELLSAECAAGPLALVLEDLHWGDLPSVMLIDAALSALPGAPLFVVAAARPELRQQFPALWAERDPWVTQLGPLGRRASEQIVREALGVAADEATVSRLSAQAAGNPFCLEELIRAVAAGEGERLPETVLGVVQARLDALPAASRRVLRAASVFGEVFWRGAVIALLGGEEHAGDVDDELAALSLRETLTRRGEGRFPGEEEYAFRHALVREAAYAALTEDDRALGHRLAGAWLERWGEVDAAALAGHHERGGEPERAVGWYRLAALEALEGNDFTGALAHAARGVACGARGELLGELRRVQAEAHKWRGENQEAEACALSALEHLSPGSSGWYAAAGELTVTSLRLGHTDRLTEVSAALRDRLAELSSVPAPERAAERAAGVVAASRAAIGLAHAGILDLAEPVLALAEALAASLCAPEPGVHARVLQARASRSQATGDVGGYLARMLEVAARFDEAGDARMAANARVGVGYAYLEVGAWADAERVLREVRAATTRLGLPQIASSAAHNLGLVLARRGALAEARSVEAASIEVFRRQGDRRMEAASRSYLAEILLLSGDIDEAVREAQAATALPAGPSVRARVLATLSQVLTAASQVEAALEAAEQAMVQLEALGGSDLGEGFLRLAHVEALIHAGRADEARSAAAVAREHLLEHAGRIQDEALRASYLERVPENARILELAEESARK